MEQSQSIIELSKALCNFQGEVPAIAKENTNPFFKSKYADLSSIIQTAKPFLKKNGLAITQVSERCADCVVITTQLMHTSGEWIRGTEEMKPVKNDPQGRGSAITYSRRYAYSSILGLATEDDDDGNSATHKVEVKEKTTAKVDMKEANKVFNELILTLNEIESLQDLKDFWTGAMSEINSLPDNLKKQLTEIKDVRKGNLK